MSTQRLVRPLVTWGARCRKAARWDLLGARSARDTSTNQSCTPGSTGGAFCEGHVYQPTEGENGEAVSDQIYNACREHGL